MKKRAFTLVEMVIVIVVLGVVAMIGTNIITHMYEGYVRSRVVNKLQADSELILDQISKRLQYRIKDSTVASIDGKLSTYLKLNSLSLTKDYDVLEWIGYDNEGLVGEWDGRRFSGWSGFIDIDNNKTTNLSFVTNGSNLNNVKNIIDDLSYNSVDLNSKNGGAAIIFKCSHNNSVASYGYLGPSHSKVFTVFKKSKNELAFDNPLSLMEYCEHYRLVWSAYAIAPENITDAKDASGKIIKDAAGNTIKDFDLYLYYDYQPWQNERFKSGKKALIAKHVSTFRFIQVGSTVRIKLCLRDTTTKYGFCKERAVY